MARPPKKKLHQIKRRGKVLRRTTRRHAADILRPQDHPAPWAWMFLCATATTLPVFLGYLRGEAPLAIYGALSGYFISLCDPPGNFAKRFTIATLAFLGTYLGFTCGLFLHHSLFAFSVSLAVSVYVLGLFGGGGIEVERLFLFSIVEFVLAHYHELSVAHFARYSIYNFVAIGTVLIGITASSLFPKKPESSPTVLTLIRSPATLALSRHLYSLSFVLSVLLAVYFVERYKIPRGYWTIITVLLITKPNRKENFYRIIQRFFGTSLGILAGEFVILLQPSLEWTLSALFLCALLVPFVWKRNYWLVTFLATNLVILLLNIAYSGHPDSSLTILRFKATFLGCVIGVIFPIIRVLFTRAKRKES